MQLLTTDINTRYSQGNLYLSNITFNKFLKDQYGVQYKSSAWDNRLLMLMFAVDSWDNRPGADNWLTTQQMYAILDQIAYAHRDPLTAMCSTDTTICGCSKSSMSFSVMDTNSIQLLYVNGVLKANLKVSSFTNNGLSVQNDGAFSQIGSGSGSNKIFITSSDFTVGTNTYSNPLLIGKSPLVWYRGMGYLLHDFNNPSNPANEYTILSGGGITITIPGFDVHSDTNYFYIQY